MSVKKILVGTVIALAVIATGIYVFREPLATMAIQKIATKRMAENPLASLPDGLYIGLCGAGSPFPDPKRSPACTAVIAGKRLFLIDAGSAASRNLNAMGFNPSDVEALFLTHFHSDHIDGMGELFLQRWGGSGRTEPLPVYGPTGVEMIVGGLMQAYAQDTTYRVAHHGAATMPPSGAGAIAKQFAAPSANGRVVLIDEPDLQIVAFSVGHAPIHPAVGYRVRYKDRTAVISGDTSKNANLQKEAKDVDLLVHEALQPRLTELLRRAAEANGRTNLENVFRDILNYHTTPEEAAEIARDANVGFLLYSHIVPALPFPGLDGLFLGDAPNIFKGRMKVGIDGDFVSLPVGSKAIELSKRR